MIQTPYLICVCIRLKAPATGDIVMIVTRDGQMNRHIVGELWYSLPKDTTSGLLKWLADWKNRYGLKWYMSSVLYSTKITRRSMPLNLKRRVNETHCYFRNGILEDLAA